MSYAHDLYVGPPFRLRVMSDGPGTGLGQNLAERALYTKGGARTVGIVSPTNRPIGGGGIVSPTNQPRYADPVYRALSGDIGRNPRYRPNAYPMRRGSGKSIYPVPTYVLMGDDPSLLPAPRQSLSASAIVGWSAVVVAAAGVFWAVTSGWGLKRNARRKRKASSRADIDRLGRRVTYKITPLKSGWGVRKMHDGKIAASEILATRADAQQWIRQDLRWSAKLGHGGKMASSSRRRKYQTHHKVREYPKKSVRRNPRSVWRIVYTQGGPVLAVYGDALREQARAKAEEIERKTGVPTYAAQVSVRGPRPSVGESVETLFYGKGR